MKTPNVAHWIVTIITVMAAAYGIWSAEFGSVFRGPKLKISTSDVCRIVESYGQLGIRINIHIRNTGKKVGSITKMTAFLRKKQVIEKIFMGRAYAPHDRLDPGFSVALGPFTVDAGDVWSARVDFAEEITEEEERKINKYKFELTRNLQEKFNKNPEPQGLYFIDDSLFMKIRASVLSRLNSIQIGDYQLLFIIWDGSGQRRLLGYRFRLTEMQVKGIKEFEVDAYRSRPEFNPKYLTYSLTPRLKKITEKSELETLLDSCLSKL